LYKLPHHQKEKKVEKTTKLKKKESTKKMNGNYSEMEYGCPNIAGTLLDFGQYSIDKKLGCIRQDGTSCCVALCDNGYRCQREAVLQFPLSSAAQHQDVTCQRFITSGSLETNSKPDFLVVCKEHATMFQQSTTQKPFSYLSWTVSEAAVVVCKSVAAVIIMEGAKMALGITSGSIVPTLITAGAGTIGATLNAKVIDPYVRNRLK
jgi:hypothetical protein